MNKMKVIAIALPEFVFCTLYGAWLGACSGASDGLGNIADAWNGGAGKVTSAYQKGKSPAASGGSPTSPSDREVPDKNCITLPNGDCVGTAGCMHDIQRGSPEELATGIPSEVTPARRETRPTENTAQDGCTAGMKSSA